MQEQNPYKSESNIFNYQPPPPPPCEVCGGPSTVSAMTIVEDGIKDGVQNYAVFGSNRFFCAKHKPHFTLFPIKELYPGYRTSAEMIDQSYINAV